MVSHVLNWADTGGQTFTHPPVQHSHPHRRAVIFFTQPLWALWQVWERVCVPVRQTGRDWHLHIANVNYGASARTLQSGGPYRGPWLFAIGDHGGPLAVWGGRQRPRYSPEGWPDMDLPRLAPFDLGGKQRAANQERDKSFSGSFLPKCGCRSCDTWQKWQRARAVGIFGARKTESLAAQVLCSVSPRVLCRKQIQKYRRFQLFFSFQIVRFLIIQMQKFNKNAKHIRDKTIYDTHTDTQNTDTHRLAFIPTLHILAKVCVAKCIVVFFPHRPILMSLLSVWNKKKADEWRRNCSSDWRGHTGGSCRGQGATPAGQKCETAEKEPEVRTFRLHQGIYVFHTFLLFLFTC